MRECFAGMVFANIVASNTIIPAIINSIRTHFLKFCTPITAKVWPLLRAGSQAERAREAIINTNISKLILVRRSQP